LSNLNTGLDLVVWILYLNDITILPVVGLDILVWILYFIDITIYYK